MPNLVTLDRFGGKQIRFDGFEHFEDNRDFSLMFGRKPRKRNRKSRSVHWDYGKTVLDQEDQPACVGYSLEYRLRAKPIQQRLSALGIYTIAQHFDEWEGEDYDGTSLRAGVKVLHKLEVFTDYMWITNLDEFCQAMRFGPVVGGMNWYEEMCYPDPTGMITVDGKLLGGHAIMFFFVDFSAEIAGVIQSWGPDWGIYGRAFIRFPDLARLIAEDGEFCLPVEASMKVR